MPFLLWSAHAVSIFLLHDNPNVWMLATHIILAKRFYIEKTHVFNVICRLSNSHILFLYFTRIFLSYKNLEKHAFDTFAMLTTFSLVENQGRLSSGTKRTGAALIPYISDHISLILYHIYFNLD